MEEASSSGMALAHCVTTKSTWSVMLILISSRRAMCRFVRTRYRSSAKYLNVKILWRMETECESYLTCYWHVCFTGFVVALNLRPVMAAIGPLFLQLQHDAGLSATQLSLLTTLPVIMMGLAALAGPLLRRLVKRAALPLA